MRRKRRVHDDAYEKCWQIEVSASSLEGKVPHATRARIASNPLDVVSFQGFLPISDEERFVPNIKAAIKWTRASEKRRMRNLAVKSKLKTLVKKASAQDSTATSALAASSALDKAAARGIIHKNKAARQKSRIAKKASAKK